MDAAGQCFWCRWNLPFYNLHRTCCAVRWMRVPAHRACHQVWLEYFRQINGADFAAMVMRHTWRVISNGESVEENSKWNGRTGF
jgi:hypothetical protein